MKNKIYFNWILILASFFSYGQKDKVILFENQKLTISFHDGALKQKFNHLTIDDEVFDTISIRFYSDQKKYIGKEKGSNLKFLKNKYLKMAMELENQKFHDLSPTDKDFKIVHEVKNNNIYYYLSSFYSYHIINFGSYESKSNTDYDCWIYYGEKPFWFEFTLNGKVVAWKKYVF